MAFQQQLKGAVVIALETAKILGAVVVIPAGFVVALGLACAGDLNNFGKDVRKEGLGATLERIAQTREATRGMDF